MTIIQETYISRQLQLKLEDFLGAKFYNQHSPVDSN